MQDYENTYPQATGGVLDKTAANTFQPDEKQQKANYEKLEKTMAFYQRWLEKDPTDCTLHLDTTKLPPFLKDYVVEVGRHTDALPSMVVTAALPYYALMIGNSIYVRANARDHFCRLWAMLIGPSTYCRKSTCLSIARQTLKSWEESLGKMSTEEQKHQRSVMNSSTAASLLKLLSENPNRLWELPESNFLMQSSRLLYNAGLLEQLTALYDGISYSAHNMERSTFVKDPALSIAGAITTADFLTTIKSFMEVGSGFLQRFVFAVAGTDLNPSFSLPNSDSELHLDYEDIFKIFRSIDGQHELRLSRAQKEALARHTYEAISKLKENDLLAQFASRIYSGTFYAILIITVLMEKYQELEVAIEKGETARFFENLIISDEAFDATLYLCSFYEETSASLFDAVGRHHDLTHEKRIIKNLLKTPYLTQYHSKLLQNTNMKATEMKMIIDQLEQKNFIEVDELCTSSGKYCKIYRLIHPDD